LKVVLQERPTWDEEGKYRFGNVEVYFEADSTPPLDPKDKPSSSYSDKFVLCDLNSTLLKVLQHKHCIIPQYPVFFVVAKNSAYREAFLNQ